MIKRTMMTVDFDFPIDVRDVVIMNGAPRYRGAVETIPADPILGAMDRLYASGIEGTAEEIRVMAERIVREAA